MNSIMPLEKPDCYRFFTRDGNFQDANKKIKFQESTNFWIFKTGPVIYKVKKNQEKESAISMEELFCTEMVRILSLHSPNLEPEALGLIKKGDSFEMVPLDGSHTEIAFYLIKMNQLTESYFLSHHLSKGKVNETMIQKIGEFLAQFHQKTVKADMKSIGNQDYLYQALSDVYYQSKKYLNKAITQPIIDRTLHPLEKFYQDHKKLLSRRLRKGNVKEVHGNFLPQKIYYRKGEVFALGKSTMSLGNRFSDEASDLADLAVELRFAGYPQLGELLIQEYISHTDNKDIETIQPFFQGLKCLSRGLENCILMANSEGKEAEEYQKTASKYYHQTLEVVKQLSI